MSPVDLVKPRSATFDRLMSTIWRLESMALSALLNIGVAHVHQQISFGDSNARHVAVVPVR